MFLNKGHLLYFRKKFNLPSNAIVDSAIIRMTADNYFTAYFNGKMVGKGNLWGDVYEFDVKELLKKNNVIAIEAANKAGDVAGLLFSLKILFKDGREMTVVKAAVDSFTGIVGAGNGDGIANPGETIVILVNEGGKYIRTNAYTLHPQLNAHNTIIRISDSWQEYDHIGGSSKYTKPVISSGEASGKDICLYIQYWLPRNISGQHIIKKGKINIEVKGKDETPPQIQWLQVLTNDRIEARVYDGSHVDKVALTFVPNEEKSTMKHVSWENVPKAFEVQLVDTGLDGDAVKGDGVYSRKIENQPSYFYSLIVKTIDSEDNNEVFEWPEVFLLKNTK